MEALYRKCEPILRENWQFLVVAGGLLLLLGSIFRWNWVCGNESAEHKGLLHFIYIFWGEAGYRIAMGLLGLLLMAIGIAMLFLW
ncbi:Imm17 family immunity protein [Anaerotignum sp.]|uniref:Imm17 family immunity protein n=1 Tax=Anaerotignum sp. TaxID=2039241 RepID=UPI0028AAAFE9|nr:Imm17 family immunity protein [Anaerotignum sp.]